MSSKLQMWRSRNTVHLHDSRKLCDCDFFSTRWSDRIMCVYTQCNVLHNSNFTWIGPISFHTAAASHFCVPDSCFGRFAHSRIESAVGDVMFLRSGRNSLREGRSGSCWCRNRLALISVTTFANARKCDGSCPWVWSATRGRGMLLVRDWIAACWMKCRLVVCRGRSVAFSLWNVMWWSCGGFSTISRKSVWILFPWIFFLCLHPSPRCSRCTFDYLPLDGDPGQWIGQTTSDLWI